MNKDNKISEFDITKSLKERIVMCIVYRIVNSKHIDYYLTMWKEKGTDYIIDNLQLVEIPNRIKNIYNSYLIYSGLLPEQFLESDSYPKEEPDGSYSLRVQGYFQYDKDLYTDIDTNPKYNTFWNNSILKPNGIEIVSWPIPLTEEEYIQCKKLYNY